MGNRDGSGKGRDWRTKTCGISAQGKHSKDRGNQKVTDGSDKELLRWMSQEGQAKCKRSQNW